MKIFINGVERDATAEEGAEILAQQQLVPEINQQEVKLEAARRINAIMPDYAQRNVMAQALEAIQLYGPATSMWPEELQQVNVVVMQKWTQIKIIRAKSNLIEQMNPIPVDFRNDSYWEDN